MGDLNKKRKDIVSRVDHLNDELTELTVEYRNNKMKVHEKLEKTKREKRAKLKQRLEKRLRDQDKRMKRKYKKTYDKNMPVKMQCRVLVTKNKFDEAYAKHGSHLSTERLLTKRLKNAKSELFEQHKNVMNGLQDGHEKTIEEIENKLEDLRVDKNINEDQIRNLEEACNKQKNALLQELGKEKFDEHMKLLERIKRRKKQLQQHEDELNKKAQAENWSNDKLNNEIKALRDAYQNEVKGVLNAANTRHAAAHDILMKSGLDSDVVTAGVLHSMYDLKLQENDALRH